MPVMTMPAPIEALVEAINIGDTERFLNCFTPMALVDDWGATYAGRDEIRLWSDRELIGAGGVVTVRRATQDGERITLIVDWRSSLHSGPGRFTFTLENGKVTALRIAEA